MAPRTTGCADDASAVPWACRSATVERGRYVEVAMWPRAPATSETMLLVARMAAKARARAKAKGPRWRSGRYDSRTRGPGPSSLPCARKSRHWRRKRLKRPRQQAEGRARTQKGQTSAPSASTRNGPPCGQSRQCQQQCRNPCLEHSTARRPSWKSSSSSVMRAELQPLCGGQVAAREAGESS